MQARAVNNATFRCPDEAGAQPQNQMIDSSAERTLQDHLYTDLPIQLLSGRPPVQYNPAGLRNLADSAHCVLHIAWHA